MSAHLNHGEELLNTLCARAHTCMCVCAGVREADQPLVSGERGLLPLCSGSVLPGQWGGAEGES